MPETIDGMPLHPLVVHLPVVLGPLTGLLAIALLVPGLRARLLRPTAALAMLLALSVLVAVSSGEQLAEQRGVSEEHADAADVLRILAIALAAVLVLAVLAARRLTGALATVLMIIAAGLGAGTVAATVVTGHEGAKQVWQRGFTVYEPGRGGDSGGDGGSGGGSVLFDFD